MSVVDFKQIPLYVHDEFYGEYPTLSADKEGGGTGVVYNSDWGYFTFSQSIDFKYSADGKYISSATFTINGVFTQNATSGEIVLPSGSYAFSDEESEVMFNKLKDKYNNLVDIMNFAAEAEPPVNIQDYWGANDDRVIGLPEPLFNSEGGVVYGRPSDLSIQETLWPHLISYKAVLKEPEIVPGKVTIDEHIIDGGVIVIKAKKPRIRTQNFAFANSSEIYFGGWDERSYTVNGSLPSTPPSGQFASSSIHDIVNDLMDGIVYIGRNVEGTYTEMFPNLYIENSGVNFSNNKDGRGTSVSVSATE